MKKHIKLPNYPQEGEYLPALRLAQAGRIQLLKLFCDDWLDWEAKKPNRIVAYWLIRIANFNDSKQSGGDRYLLAKHFHSQWGNGVKRFVRQKDAETYFDALCAIPEYVTEAQEAQKLRDRRAQALRDRIADGKMKPFSPTA